MGENETSEDGLSEIELDDFHGQLYSAAAILSGLMIADSSSIIPPQSEYSILNTTLLVAFLAYFGTLLIGRFIHTYHDYVRSAYQSIILRFDRFLPVSGEFNEYHIGWVLGIIFVILLFVDSVVKTRVIGAVYLLIIVGAAIHEYRSEEIPEPSAFFRDLVAISLSSALSVVVLVTIAPFLAEVHGQFGAVLSGVISVAIILLILYLLHKSHSRESLLTFHILVGLSFPIVVTALAIILYLLPL
ncbi:MULTISPECIES: hypothetical protein [Haloferacaceae]|uniref:Uncharacterized protein n=1 Tax=Halorubrum glutamatedens TaxID=2707018 RepID=A0ABD5QPG3_9EURY|nr:hypothetical protein [Halobellus captivus]